MAELNSDLNSIVGCRIAAVECGRAPVLILEDGREVEFNGTGYDGLWDDVIVFITEPPPTPPSNPSSKTPAK